MITCPAQLFPWKPLLGGESASCVSDRGYFAPSNATTGHVNALDQGCVDNAWASAAERPWVGGNFAWTGYVPHAPLQCERGRCPPPHRMHNRRPPRRFDYKGEPTPFSWPDINSHFGIFDIAGFPKASAGYYRAWWLNDPTAITIVPTQWTNPVPAGSTTPVVVYTLAPVVGLWVNGVSQGNQTVPAYGFAYWQSVTFTPGNITAIGYDADGAIISTQTLTSTGPPAAIRLTIDAGVTGINADGHDVAMIAVAIVDATGAVVPYASNNVTFSVSGSAADAAIFGVANGDPADHTPDKATYRLAFNGLARVLVQAGFQTGTAQLTATSPGINPASINIDVVPAGTAPIDN